MHVRRFVHVLIVGVLMTILLGYSLFLVSKSRTFQFYGEIVARVETDEKVIALTFDDGPTENTPEVLRILNETKTPATFYLIGKDIEKYPKIAQEINAHGHELGNHSYSHQRFLLKSSSFVKEEIEKTNDLLRMIGWEKEITFRPPYGKKLFSLPSYLEENGIKTVMWDVEPDSFAPKEYEGKKEFLVKYTLENTQPGSIILLHPHCDSCQPARDALPEIISGLKEQGYRFVTVSELL